MARITMNNLWSFIESLSLSPKERDWLVDKLLEPTHNVDPYQYSPSCDSFFADLHNVKAVENDIEATHHPDARFTRLESCEDVMSMIETL